MWGAQIGEVDQNPVMVIPETLLPEQGHISAKMGDMERVTVASILHGLHPKRRMRASKVVA